MKQTRNLNTMTITLPEPLQLARSHEMIELSGEDFESPYMPAIREAYNALRTLRQYIAEVSALRTHHHEWSTETGFCYICGADGNA